MESRDLLNRLGLLALLLLGVLAAWNPIVGDDQWWHMLTGQVVLESGSVPTTDLFSFTYLGQPWINWEWLAGVGMMLAWEAAGPLGLVLLRTAAVLALLMISWRRMSWRAPVARNWTPIVELALAALMLLVVFGRISDRPHVYAYPFLATAVLLADRMKRLPGAGVAVGLAVLIAVWSMLHPSWLLGMVYVAAAGADTALAVGIRDRQKLNRRVVLMWLAIPIVSVLLISAFHEFGGYLSAVTDIFSTSGLSEWKALTDYWIWRTFPLHAFALVALLFVWMLVKRPARLLNLRVLLMLLLMITAFFVVRFTAIFAIIAVPRLYSWLCKALEKQPDQGKPARVLVVVSLMAILLFMLVLRVYDKPFSASLDPRSVPVGVGEYMTRHDLGGNVYSTTNNAASYLAMLRWPRIKVFIDGRVPQLFPASFYHFYKRCGQPDVFQDLIERNPIEYVLIIGEPGDYHRPMAELLDKREDFSLLYFDDYAALYQRHFEGQERVQDLGGYRIIRPWLMDVDWWRDVGEAERFAGFVRDIARMRETGILNQRFSRRVLETAMRHPQLSDQQRQAVLSAAGLAQSDQ
jgi:hypothetical protein